MAKIIYVSGVGKPKSDKVPGVTTFWHIRKPRTKQTTLCGAYIERGLTFKTKKPKRDTCNACRRIHEGLDPVFDRSDDDRYGRPEHSPRGTRAGSQPDPTSGKQVA